MTTGTEDFQPANRFAIEAHHINQVLRMAARPPGLTSNGARRQTLGCTLHFPRGPCRVKIYRPRGFDASTLARRSSGRLADIEIRVLLPWRGSSMVAR